MKQIPHRTAVQTILYYVPPTQHLIVIDRENMYDNGTVVFDGLSADINDLKYAKYERSEVHEVRAENNTLTLIVETKYEEY